MGKIRTRIIGLEDVEEKQKAGQKKRSQAKKLDKKKKKESVVEQAGETDTQPEAAKPEKKAKKKKAAEVVTAKPAKKKSRHHQAAMKLIDKNKLYPVDEAVELLKKIKYSHFDESVELHINVDAEGLKGELELPFSTGKMVNVKILDDKVLEEIEKGTFKFDVLVTHPSYMPKLAKFAKVLGPRGLMPNPKAGTVSTTPEEVVKKFSKGMLRWKTEPKAPIIHQMIGKVSQHSNNLSENARSFIRAVGTAHIKTVFLKSTMSPSLKLDIEKL